jgi:hypothetical protein
MRLPHASETLVSTLVQGVFKSMFVPALQFVGRWKIEVDPAQPRAFDDTDVPVTNPDLDPLLQVRKHTCHTFFSSLVARIMHDLVPCRLLCSLFHALRHQQQAIFLGSVHLSMHPCSVITWLHPAGIPIVLLLLLLLLLLLQVQCSFDPSGRCAVPRDTMLMMPGTRTRIAFNGPQTSGLFAWNS